MNKEKSQSSEKSRKEVRGETRKEFENNMHRTYSYKNRGLEIKMKTMELLYQQLELLAKESEKLEGKERHQAIEIMAKLGQAIIPD